MRSQRTMLGAKIRLPDARPPMVLAFKRRCQVLCRALKGDEKQPLHTKLAIIGSGPAAHTAAIYAGRAELEPILFEGWMAGGIAPGGQLTTTSYVENFPGFVEPIMGIDLTDKFRAQSLRYGTRIFTETVTSVDLMVHGKRTAQPPGLYRSANLSRSSMEDGPAPSPSSSVGDPAPQPHRPFTLVTPERTVTADAVIIATGASAKRLHFPGSGDESEGGFWNRGISACAICDGSSPMLRNKPVAVVGGGDSAMEEAMFLTRYASKVYIIHRFNYLEASKSMSRRALANPKIEILWGSEIKEAHGSAEGNLSSITITRSLAASGAPSLVGQVQAVPAAAAVATDGTPVATQQVDVSGLFFAIGHRPATEFLKGQLALSDYGYVVVEPGTSITSVPGVFAAGDVADAKYRQAIVAAGHGCIAALEAERYLQALEAGSAPAAAAAKASSGEGGMPQQYTPCASGSTANVIGSTATELELEEVSSSGGA